MSELRYGLQSIQSETLQNWIEAQMMRGRYTFNKEDITGLGVHNNKDSLNRALYRAQENSKKIWCRKLGLS